MWCLFEAGSHIATRETVSARTLFDCHRLRSDASADSI